MKPGSVTVREMAATAAAADYAGADQANATRIIALICSLTALLSLIFLPLDPPTEAIGVGGWAIAAGLIALGFVGGRRLRHRRPPPSFTFLLGVSYLGLGAVAVLQWLGGGADAAYHEVILIWAASAMGIHPLPRALAFLLVTAAMIATPLLYEGWSTEVASDVGAEIAFVSALGLVMFGLMTYIRAERVQLRDQEREAHTIARADELTGLGNRRAFDEALGSELARSRRAGSTTSIALVDLDGFKSINDRFGHLDGDRCLRAAAEAIGRALRAGDGAFRWGGDEFALVMPDTAHEGAEKAAARIAAEVLQTCTTSDGAPLSVSWGVAEAADGMGTDELLGRADLALLALKREKLAA